MLLEDGIDDDRLPRRRIRENVCIGRRGFVEQLSKDKIPAH
jgi:hypothetical protein